MRTRLALAIAVALSAGCQLTPPGGAGPKATPRPGKSSTPPVAEGAAGRIPLEAARRVIDAADLTAKTKLTVAELTGKAKLISDKGLGIVSNNSGGLISDKGLGLVSNNGGGLVSNNGGGLTAKTKYGLAQGGARPESLLAEAEIEVLDAAGRVLVGKDGKPIGAVTGADGAFSLKASLPAENLVLRIRLFDGGQLFATLPKDKRGGALDLDTASSIGTRYVLDRFVKGEQAVYDRLPAPQAEALQREIEAARAVFGTRAPSYKPADLVALASELAEKDATVGKRFETIKSILLAGQADLGSGLQATAVGLAAPTGVVGDAAGNVYVAELGAFRIRRVKPDGTVSVFAGTGARDAAGKVLGQTLEAIGGIAITPAGDLLVTQQLSNQVRRIAPDGTMGTLVDVLGGLNFPTVIAAGADGRSYVGETPRSGDKDGRVLEIDAAGQVTDISPPKPASGKKVAYPGVAVAADGTLYAFEMEGLKLWRRAAGGAWQAYADVPSANQLSRIWLEPDGHVLVSAGDTHSVLRVAPDGKVVTIAGTGEGGHSGDGGPATAAALGAPAGLWRSPAGRLYIADADGFVRRVAPDGTISTFAGTTGVLAGDALGLPVNGPGGMAIDPQGRLVFAEAGSSALKRLDGTTITVMAGGVAGFAGDGGPAAAARFNKPSGIAYAPDGSLYVVDVQNQRIRKIDPAGVISTVVQHRGMKSFQNGKGPFDAGFAPMVEPIACAVDPKGRLYWSDVKSQQVLRVRDDGRAEVVAGTFEEAGDPDADKPARETKINSPFSLTFDAAGDLYFVGTANSRVLRVRGGEPTNPIETVAGLTPDRFIGLLAALGAGTMGSDEGKPATEAMLYGPTAICFDAAGALYIAELGTAKIKTFGGASLAGLPTELLAALPSTGSRIRRMGKDGTLRTVAGDGTTVLADPGSDDYMLYPLSMQVDREGRLIVADTALNQIRMVPKGRL